MEQILFQLAPCSELLFAIFSTLGPEKGFIMVVTSLVLFSITGRLTSEDGFRVCIDTSAMVYFHRIDGSTTLATYWVQLAAPLQFFASFGTRSRQAFLDGEKLQSLLSLTATVKELPGALDLEVPTGELEFMPQNYESRGGEQGVKLSGG
ncbi:ATP-binding cassette sub- B member 6, mitochondrial [Neonectria magnoliae]|uniref:ATP-binding cassette sub- B member 6, mitochondrial n=1 Tax=Neonectria magnoliae TaxID=2732573 RepID=A0ABR1I670_9HYPO